jgi:hypothetical protein
MQFQDLTGQVFNKMTVLSHQGKNKTGQSLWLCRCECGNEKTVAAHHLKSDNIKSCGCLLATENRAAWSTTHGMSKTFEWNSYHAAKKRCNPALTRLRTYNDYVGRGIEFRFVSFDQFYKEIGPRPEPKKLYSLERKDNDGHYEPGNVKWATKGQQARNRRCDNCKLFQERIRELEGIIKLLGS